MQTLPSEQLPSNEGEIKVGKSADEHDCLCWDSLTPGTIMTEYDLISKKDSQFQA